MDVENIKYLFYKTFVLSKLISDPGCALVHRNWTTQRERLDELFGHGINNIFFFLNEILIGNIKDIVATVCAVFEPGACVAAL